MVCFFLTPGRFHYATELSITSHEGYTLRKPHGRKQFTILGVLVPVAFFHSGYDYLHWFTADTDLLLDGVSWQLAIIHWWAREGPWKHGLLGVS